MATDWQKLQNEYLETGISLKALAVKHRVGTKALGRMAASEGWASIKRAQALLGRQGVGDAGEAGALLHVPDAAQPPSPSPVSEEERRARLAVIRDQLTAQLLRATVELDKQVLKHKRKTREIVYDGQEARGKPVEETTQEDFELEIVDATVSCTGLQRLSATLKNLSAVAREGGGDAQSVALVIQLMQKLDSDAGASGKV